MRNPLVVALSLLTVLLAGATGCAADADRGEATDARDDALTDRAARASAWDSPEACEAAVAARQVTPREAGRARIATWNLRWFPDGTMPRSGGKPKPTNLAWVACAIRFMDVDVLAIEEILTHDRAKAAIDVVLARLDELSGGDWRAAIDPCPNANAQHQGFLYDARRVVATHVRHFDWREGDSCNMTRRPAYAGYFRFASGLNVHLAAVHAKSGADGASYDLRAEALSKLGDLYDAAQREEADADVVVLGDFNTMGSEERATDATAEIAALDRASRSAGFRRVRSDRFCSEYSSGESKLLDHVLVSYGMDEAKVAVKSTVTGYCAALGCRASDAMPRAYAEMSDHCPLLVDLDARDVDD